MIGNFTDCDEAREMAATVGITLSADDEVLGPQLELAAIDIDGEAFQGMKYDRDQLRKFPRYKRSSARGETYPTPSTPSLVWDWNNETNTAVIPRDVKLANIFQVQWNTSAAGKKSRNRIEAIQSGLTSQKIGSAEEQYVGSSKNPGGEGARLSLLCQRAQQLLKKYRLKSGVMK
jgi:hypothetical protein